MDRGSWWATAHGVAELDMNEQLITQQTHTHTLACAQLATKETHEQIGNPWSALEPSVLMLCTQCSTCLPQVRVSSVVMVGLKEGSFEVIVWNWCRMWTRQKSDGCESKIHPLGPVRSKAPVDHMGVQGAADRNRGVVSEALSQGLGQRAGVPPTQVVGR